LANWLILNHNRQQNKNKAWETPNILSISSWLKNVWLEAWPDQYLLSKIQSESLWKKIIQNDVYIKKLSVIHKESLTGQAFKAYKLVNEYRIILNKKNFLETTETHSFFKWTKEYNKQLLEWNAIDESSLMDRISKFIDEGKINLPTSIIFKGFKDKTPQLQSLLDSLERKKVKIQLELPDGKNKVKTIYENTNISIQSFDDKNKEVITCARWIRKNYKPGKSFGIIVADLKNYHSLLQREFAAELYPESIHPEKKTELPFNISTGLPLTEISPINLILQILKTPGPEIPAGKFYSIIKSPIFNLEKATSLELEAKMRKQRKYSVNINKFPLDLYKENSPQILKLITAWKTWISNEKKNCQAYGPSQ